VAAAAGQVQCQPAAKDAGAHTRGLLALLQLRSVCAAAFLAAGVCWVVLIQRHLTAEDAGVHTGGPAGAAAGAKDDAAL
jgi:hypothetical protein